MPLKIQYISFNFKCPIIFIFKKKIALNYMNIFLLKLKILIQFQL